MLGQESPSAKSLSAGLAARWFEAVGLAYVEDEKLGAITLRKMGSGGEYGEGSKSKENEKDLREGVGISDNFPCRGY